VARQRVVRSHVAVARPRTHGGSALIHFDLQYVATAFRRLRRCVPHNVVLILFLADLLHAANHVVRVGDHEPPGAFRQQVHDLLIVGRAGWKSGNVQARRIVVWVVRVVRIVPVVRIVGIIRPAAVVGVGVGVGGVVDARAGVAGIGPPRRAGPRPRVATGVARGSAARGAARGPAAGRPRVATRAATRTAAAPPALLFPLGGGKKEGGDAQ